MNFHCRLVGPSTTRFETRESIILITILKPLTGRIPWSVKECRSSCNGSRTSKELLIISKSISVPSNQSLINFLIFSYTTRHAQLHHPYLETYFLPQNHPMNTPIIPIQPHEYFSTHALVPANPLLHVEAPKWLRIYIRSSSEKDHIIKWNMFQVHQLVYINEMLTKLFKEECHDIWGKYEAVR